MYYSKKRCATLVSDRIVYLYLYLSIVVHVQCHTLRGQPCCPPTIDALPSADDDRLHSRHSWLDCQDNFANVC